MLASIQSQVRFKSSVECASIYTEAETAKNRNDNLTRSSVPIFTDHMTLTYTSNPATPYKSSFHEQKVQLLVHLDDRDVSERYEMN